MEGEDVITDFKNPREVFHENNTLVCLIKGLVGEVTTIDLINECSVHGKIENVDYKMNTTMTNVIFTDLYEDEIKMEVFFVRGRMIRFVHIPERRSITKTIQQVLKGNKNSLTVADVENRFMKQSSKTVSRGRGRGTKPVLQASNLLSKHRDAGKQRGLEYMGKLEKERQEKKSNAFKKSKGESVVNSKLLQRLNLGKDNDSSASDGAESIGNQNDSDSSASAPRSVLDKLKPSDLLKNRCSSRSRSNSPIFQTSARFRPNSPNNLMPISEGNAASHSATRESPDLTKSGSVKSQICSLPDFKERDSKSEQSGTEKDNKIERSGKSVHVSKDKSKEKHSHKSSDKSKKRNSESSDHESAKNKSDGDQSNSRSRSRHSRSDPSTSIHKSEISTKEKSGSSKHSKKNESGDLLEEKHSDKDRHSCRSKSKKSKKHSDYTEEDAKSKNKHSK